MWMGTVYPTGDDVILVGGTVESHVGGGDVEVVYGPLLEGEDSAGFRV